MTKRKTCRRTITTRKGEESKERSKRGGLTDTDDGAVFLTGLVGIGSLDRGQGDQGDQSQSDQSKSAPDEL